MSFNRRQFLNSSAAVVASAPLTQIRAASGPAGFVVVEKSVPESASFARDFATGSRIDCALAAPMHLHAQIVQAMTRAAPVIGCTREAGAFVIGEMLRGGNFRLDVVGRHTHTGLTGVHHDLRCGSPGDLRASVRQRDWPRRIARALCDAGQRPMTEAQTVDTENQRMTGSPGYVVTWRLLPA